MPEGQFVYIQNPKAHGADKYHGAVAEGYDAKREDSPKWKAEQRIIEDMLGDLPAETKVLDVPIGTGRFIEFYREKGFKVLGVDRSDDMLRVASDKVGDAQNITLLTGDILKLNMLGDKSFDVALMVRLTRWLSPEDCTKAIHELARVTRKRIVFTTRLRHATHPELARRVTRSLTLMPTWRLRGFGAVAKNQDPPASISHRE